MTPEEQQQVNAAYEANLKEALSAQRNEHSNKEAHWFAQSMAAQKRIEQLEAKVKELTPTEPAELKAVKLVAVVYTNFFGSAFFGGGFFGAGVQTGDTHDGYKDVTEINRKLDRQREERDESRKSHRARLREIIEDAFNPQVEPSPVQAEVKKLAEPSVKRLESGKLSIDWQRLEKKKLDDRIYAFREAFYREQALIEDEEEVILLAMH